MMQRKGIHKKGFVPEPPQGCDLSKESILLHCCCAPCSTAIIEWMVGEGLHPGIFFSNSNIVPFREYEIRRKELHRYAAAHGLEAIDDEYDHSAWLAHVRRLEICAPAEIVEAPYPAEAQTHAIRLSEMPERGPRCLECFKFRLLRAARYAASHGYTLLTTTLASSRWKDLNQVDAAGRWACDMVNADIPDSFNHQASRQVDPLAFNPDSLCLGNPSKVLLWNQNWRRGGLQERRNALIKEWEMYNQTFCGCEFSERH